MTLWLFLALALLQVVDVVTTWAILRRGGVELNPWLAKAFSRFGVLPVLAASKVALLAWVWWLLPYVALLIDPAYPLAVAIARYVWIANHNIKQWRISK